jgi:sugar lactone lactonase YvrE
MRMIRVAGIFLSLLLLSGFSGRTALADLPKAVQAWQTSQELMVPESVMFDADKQLLYVSNIVGKPTDKDGQGFISQVTLDGAIKKLRWVEGMNAPKGMGIFKGTLYVTDIDRIHAIDIASGAIKITWDVDGAKFLNDIAIDPEGTVYISDMETKKLHAIRDGKLEGFLVLQQAKPNGLLMQGNQLLLGTAEGLYEVDTTSKTVALRIAHSGGIDGLKLLAPGRYIVSDWAGKTQVIENDKPPIVLLDTSAQKINSADLEYIAEKNLLLIPTFFDNRVVAYRLQ